MENLSSRGQAGACSARVRSVYRERRIGKKCVLSEVCVGGWEIVSVCPSKNVCVCVCAGRQHDMWENVCVCVGGSGRIILQRLSLVCERKQLSALVLG